MRRPSWLSPLAIVATGLVSAVAVIGYGQYRVWREIEQLHRSLNYADWRSYRRLYENEPNRVRLDVGVIQFIGRGYSITLDSVSYDPAGVRLVGHVGNPNLINVSSLTLTITVNRPLDESRDEYVKSRSGALAFELGELRNNRALGTAQVMVGTVNAGTSVPFRVVVPNVKQRAEPYDVVVAFSGERYSYMR